MKDDKQVCAIEDIMISEVVLELGGEERTFQVLDTSLCYICGHSNFTGTHVDPVSGFGIQCPSGITRAEADEIRLLRSQDRHG